MVQGWPGPSPFPPRTSPQRWWRCAIGPPTFWWDPSAILRPWTCGECRRLCRRRLCRRNDWRLLCLNQGGGLHLHRDAAGSTSVRRRFWWAGAAAEHLDGQFNEFWSGLDPVLIRSTLSTTLKALVLLRPLVFCRFWASRQRTAGLGSVCCLITHQVSSPVCIHLLKVRSTLTYISVFTLEHFIHCRPKLFRDVWKR